MLTGVTIKVGNIKLIIMKKFGLPRLEHGLLQKLPQTVNRHNTYNILLKKEVWLQIQLLFIMGEIHL